MKGEGEGTRKGKFVNRLNRNVLSRIEASGTLDVEVATSGFGILLEAVMGEVTTTVSGGVSQQVHTLEKDDFLKSFTIQGVVPTLGGGATLAQTFTGCMAESIEFTASEGEILKASIPWTARDMVTNESAAVASYPTNDLFTFLHGEIAVRAGSTFTPPTASAIAAVGIGDDVAANVKTVSVKIENGLDSGGYNLGGAGKRSRKRALGKRTITGSLQVELTDSRLRDRFVSQTSLYMILTFTHGSGADAPTLQIVLPSILLKGGIPKSNNGDVITIDADFEAFDNGTSAEPIWVVYRSADTAP